MSGRSVSALKALLTALVLACISHSMFLLKQGSMALDCISNGF